MRSEGVFREPTRDVPSAQHPGTFRIVREGERRDPEDPLNPMSSFGETQARALAAQVKAAGIVRSEFPGESRATLGVGAAVVGDESLRVEGELRATGTIQLPALGAAAYSGGTHELRIDPATNALRRALKRHRFVVDPADMLPENELSTMPGTLHVGGAKAAGGVLASNGKIYCMPRNSTRVIIIDPVANTFDTGSMFASSATEKYYGGVEAPNGKIYCIPRNAGIVAIIDPVAGTFDEATITGVGSSWVGGVLATNGKIYGIPSGASTVLIINPDTDTVDNTSINITAIKHGTASYWGGALGPDGKIYCAPTDATGVLVIDPFTDTASLMPGTLGTGLIKWVGCVTGPDGKIYGIPAAATAVLIINPATNTHEIGTIVSAGGNHWQFGAMGANGKIYGCPYDSSRLLIIDPVTATASTPETSLATGGFKFRGAVCAPNGTIYFIPSSSETIGTLKTGLPAVPGDWQLGPEFNKA